MREKERRFGRRMKRTVVVEVCWRVVTVGYGSVSKNGGDDSVNKKRKNGPGERVRKMRDYGVREPVSYILFSYGQKENTMMQTSKITCVQLWHQIIMISYMLISYPSMLHSINQNIKLFGKKSKSQSWRANFREQLSC